MLRCLTRSKKRSNPHQHKSQANQQQALFSYLRDNANGGKSARNERQIKMLLLGAGESGKSTIAKQIKVIHNGGFNSQESKKFVQIINSNILSSLLLLYDRVKTLNMAIGCHECFRHTVDYIQRNEAELKVSKGIQVLPQEIITNIKTILRDPNIVKCLLSSHKIVLGDSAAYFFRHFDRIAAPDYTPTYDDIIRSRVKTIGISETHFTYKNYAFVLNDVGGQQSERRKWIHCFKSVDLVLFVASLTEYNKPLVEDRAVNGMLDSIELFRSIIKINEFKKTSFVLILNKSDLFEEMIKYEPITRCFPDYDGPCTLKDCSDFILRKFLACNTDENRFIYSHVTCATDTSNVEFLFNSVADTLIRSELNELITFLK